MNICDIFDYKKFCCGCESCESVCPKSAITMKSSSEGFLYPAINNSCIDCGTCIRVCPAVNPCSQKDNISEYFWGYSRNDFIRKSSSSGGIFTELANLIIASKGIIFGAAEDADLTVKHKEATNQKELCDLKKSKYVQSSTNCCYFRVRTLLDSGIQVLFSGTPCQVAGLRSYLGIDYNNLLTVDFICHGVPSPGLYADMIKYYEWKYHGKIQSITFREKDRGWREQITKLYFEDNRVISLPSLKTLYYNFFLKNLTLRKSCYSCSFCAKHYSDITLGDYWGTSNSDNFGTSIIVLSSNKGKELFHEIQENIVYGTLQPEKIFACYLPHENNPEYNVEKREAFFKEYALSNYLAVCRRHMGKILMQQYFSLLRARWRSVIYRVKRLFEKDNIAS